MIVTEEGHVLTQSLAIIEYLDARNPDPPFLPENPLERARVRAMAFAVVAETHPLPMMVNVRRYNVSTADFPTLVDIDARLRELATFRDAGPENHPAAHTAELGSDRSR